MELLNETWTGRETERDAERLKVKKKVSGGWHREKRQQYKGMQSNAENKNL